MMTRQQFLRSLAGLGAGAFVVACSNSDGSPGPVIDAPTGDAPAQLPDGPMPDAPPNTTCASTTATISANHSHSVTVSGADVMAGVEKIYNIKGTSPHPHTITVTAAMFTMLKAGQSVTVTSSNDEAHTHNVTITCA